eukprot:CAMPEP_0196742054 /NCGR_PEP_ID=MMETSP1091-20130531/44186_1 /TAXON_ID=302021 /ORGANISM="Rhodomonas sp., Strain CCMP768" /LENGTH=46 /DNA_ID= /DNA_START= /DNA_END= /DNA_ORIENTATION=
MQDGCVRVSSGRAHLQHRGGLTATLEALSPWHVEKKLAARWASMEH